MKTTVTFETAKALRDAGFPQPLPAEEQFWYIENDLYCCFWDDTNTRYILFAPGMIIDFEMAKGLVFAPQAHDILALDDSLKFWYSNIEKAFVCKIWVVEDGRLTGRIITDENPHEAAAYGFMGNEYEKWVKFNKKPA